MANHGSQPGCAEMANEHSCTLVFSQYADHYHQVGASGGPATLQRQHAANCSGRCISKYCRLLQSARASPSWPTAVPGCQIAPQGHSWECHILTTFTRPSRNLPRHRSFDEQLTMLLNEVFVHKRVTAQGLNW